MVKRPPKVFWGGLVPSQEVFGPLGVGNSDQSLKNFKKRLFKEFLARETERIGTSEIRPGEKPLKSTEKTRFFLPSQSV